MGPLKKCVDGAAMGPLKKCVDGAAMGPLRKKTSLHRYEETIAFMKFVLLFCYEGLILDYK